MYRIQSLNHCKQVLKPTSQYSQYKENNEVSWKVDLIIDNNHYYAIGQKQRDALLNVINDNDALLRSKKLK